MAYSNFIPTFWAAGIQRELERDCVFAEDCNRQYEGELSECGDQVKILDIGRPTIRTLARNVASGSIVDAEEVQDGSITLVVDQIRYYNIKIGDIDKKQAVNGVMDAMMQEGAQGFANAVDQYLAAFAVDENVDALYETAATVTAGATVAGTSVNVLEVLDAAIQKLRENDVALSTDLVVTVSPRFFTLLKRAYVGIDTNNSAMLHNGKVGMYGNVTVKVSNNVKKTQTSTAGDTDNIMIRTKKAIAYVQQDARIKAYEPEGSFADAVKAYILFGAKVVRPKEIVNINVKY